jgi:hypothetical protein
MNFISRLRVLSAPPIPQPNVFADLAWVALLVVIVAFVTAYFLKKRRKLVLAVTLAMLVVIAMAGSVWFLRAQIYYSFDAVQNYPIVGDSYFTINCQNTGYVAGSFSLDVLLTNANISPKTTQSYQLIGTSTARFDFTLQPRHRQSTQVYFEIDENVTDFNIQLQHEQNYDFLMTSDSNGNAYLAFVKAPTGDAFTSQGAPVPP